MSAICGYAGPGNRAALEAMIAAAAHLGDRSGMAMADGAGLGVRWHAGRGEGIHCDRQTIAAVAGSLAPAVPQTAAELAKILASPERLATLDGQFAAALFDGRRLHLLRDPFGACQLYWVRHNGVIYFASAIKQLLAIPGLPIEADPAAIHKYLTFSFVPGEEMPVRGIRRLRAGHIGVIDNAAVEETAYFTLTEQFEPRLENQQTAVRFIGRNGREAVGRRIADGAGSAGPVGLFLSGGIDSSGVAVWLKRAGVKVHAFTLDFGTESYELDQARKVAAALAMPMTEVKVEGSDVAAIMSDLVWTLDLPFGDPVTGPQYLLAKAAREAGITAVFNGEGGDQLFGGWTSKPMIAAELYAGLYGEDSREQLYLKSYHRFYGQEDLLYTPGFAAQIGPPGARRGLLAPLLNSRQATTFLNRVRLADIALKGSQNILPRMTATAQAFGLDINAPLFDRALAVASFKLPPQMKLNGAIEKFVLKCALQKALPPEVVWQRKLGMGVPVTPWSLGGGLTPVLDDLLGAASVARRGCFNADYIASLRKGQDNPGEIRVRRVGERLWTLAVLEAWLRIFIDGKGRKPEATP